MVDNSFVPRPLSPRTAKQKRDELERKMQQTQSARNTAKTTVSSGGRLDVDGGDFSVFNGGRAVVRDGGGFRVEGGGSMEIVDDGEVYARGWGTSPTTGNPVEITASLGTKEWYSDVTGQTYRYPLFKFANAEGGSSELSAFYGTSLSMLSGQEPLTYGPIAGPNIVTSSTVNADSVGTSIEAVAFDSTVTDWTGTRSRCTLMVAHASLDFTLRRPTVIDDIGFIRVSISDQVMRLGGASGTDVKGPLTVDGQPIPTGGGDWYTITNKPTAFPPSGHTHAISEVTSLQTTLNGKAASSHTHAISDVSGLQVALDAKGSAADVATLKANDAAKKVLTPLQPAGWAIEGDVFIEPFGAGVERVTISLKCKRTGGAITAPANTYQNVGVVIPVAGRSANGVQTYTPTWLLGASPFVMGIVFVAPDTGEIKFNPNSTAMTFGTNFSFTISHIWTRTTS